MEYYLWQTSLREVGSEGQQKLADAKCLVVGAGGLGCPALSYLAAAGIGTVGVCDFDRVDLTNLHRQMLYSVVDIGMPKAEAAAQNLRKSNPYIEIFSYPARVTSLLCQAYDLILDCTNNFQTNSFLNECAFLHQIPLIRASIYHFGGQMQCYLPQRGDACLYCFLEKTPQKSRVEEGVLGPLPGFFGALQAMEALKFFLGMPILPSLLLYDLVTHTQKKIVLQKNPHCSLCGSNPTITQVGRPWEVEVKEINPYDYILVDIREAFELETDRLTNWDFQHLPLSAFDATCIDAKKTYLFFCQKGKRSYDLVNFLRKEGFGNVFSLAGGINQLQ